MGKKSSLAMFIIFGTAPVVALVTAILIPATSRARKEADRAVSRTNIMGISTACYLYADAHNGEWPESLDVLAEEGVLKKESLINPSRPELKVGYIYIKPEKLADEWLGGLFVYEAYEEWGDGINTNIGFISNESELKQLLIEPENWRMRPAPASGNRSSERKNLDYRQSGDKSRVKPGMTKKTEGITRGVICVKE